MRVVIGSDHAGLRLKEALKKSLIERGHEVEDVGTDANDPVDYPDFAVAVGRAVVDKGGLGVLICGTGIGVSIAANKIPGVRAARCDEPYSAKMARAHNDANVLCMGERVVGLGLGGAVVAAFLAQPFEGGRHQRRVDQISALDR